MDIKKLVITIVVESDVEILRNLLQKQKVDGYDEIDTQYFSPLEPPPHRFGNWFGQGMLPANQKIFLAVMADNESDLLIEKLGRLKKDGELGYLRYYRMDVEQLGE